MKARQCGNVQPVQLNLAVEALFQLLNDSFSNYGLEAICDIGGNDRRNYQQYGDDAAENCPEAAAFYHAELKIIDSRMAPGGAPKCYGTEPDRHDSAAAAEVPRHAAHIA